jgi:hypothetical protein
MSSMKTLSTTLGIGLALALGAANAQTTASGPYYATPSWDQTMPSSTRFVVLSNFNGEAVLDRETGLVWERTPATFTTTFGNAVFGCVTKAVAGRYGWRLPTYPELLSLIEASHFGDYPIPAGHPFVIGSTVSFWSSTVSPFSATNHFSISANTGSQSFGASADTASNSPWCVRGPTP